MTHHWANTQCCVKMFTVNFTFPEFQVLHPHYTFLLPREKWMASRGLSNSQTIADPIV